MTLSLSARKKKIRSDAPSLRESEGLGRSVPLWQGSTPDAAIPAKVKARILLRYGGKCAITGRKLSAGEFDFDHIKPLSLGGAHCEQNLQPVYRPVHREKTAAEAGPRAKADRIRIKHLGLGKPKTRGIDQWRAFDGTIRGKARP